MAQETDAQLATRSLIIRNEATLGANTKERHDDMNQALIDSKINNDKIDAANTLDTASKTVPGRDAVKVYVAAQILAALEGLKWKQSVRVATTVNGTLASAYANGQTVDGVVLATGDRILLKNQTTQTENGIYIVNASGAPTRSGDANLAAELQGAVVKSDEGTANADTTWVQRTDSITLGSSNIVWDSFGTATPDASPSVKGKLKLFTSTGSDVDGTMDRNSITNALGGKTPINSTIQTKTANYELLETDSGKLTEMNLAIANTVTIKLQSVHPYAPGSSYPILQIGAGLTTVLFDVGVTLRTSAGVATSPGQYSPMFLVYEGSDVWYLWNGLPASAAPVQDFSGSMSATGFSAFAVQQCHYKDDGNMVTLTCVIQGTSNATTFTFSLPLASNAFYATAGVIIAAIVINNGVSMLGRAVVNGSASLVTVDSSASGSAFTASGTKGIRLTLSYFK